MTKTTDPSLEPLDRLVGTWTTEATHPLVPGVIVRGTTTFEWLEGERFLIQRARTDHPDFPDAISIIGHMEHDRVGAAGGAVPAAADASPLRVHYFDSRGVFRVFEASIDERTWRLWREAPGFSQRFTGTFSDDGDVIHGLSQLRREDVHWMDDLRITYRREA